jgi:hypothetical protein
MASAAGGEDSESSVVVLRDVVPISEAEAALFDFLGARGARGRVARAATAARHVREPRAGAAAAWRRGGARAEWGGARARSGPSRRRAARPRSGARATATRRKSTRRAHMEHAGQTSRIPFVWAAF